MARFKDTKWSIPGSDTDTIVMTGNVHTALLMDIRDELKSLNALLRCPNFTEIPATLRGIRNKLPTRKRRITTAPKTNGQTKEG